MMKKVLLGIAPVFAEVAIAEGTQSCRGHFTPAKIFVPKHALNPDIDRESAESFVAEKHNTIRDLCADPRQFTEPRAQFTVGQISPQFQIRGARTNISCGAEKILCAVTERTLAQLCFRRPGES
jgi:hypothetical protein